MQNKLEEIKQLGMYAINLWFGEDVGCDDSDVSMMDRKIVMVAFPVGCLGEVKVLFKGTVKTFLDFDFKTKPEKISNPPTENEYKENGYYIWGTERSVDNIIEKPVFGSWI